MTPGVPYIDPPPAFVNGYAARALALWLRRAWERGEFETLPPVGREQVRLTITAIECAGEAWYHRRASAIGTSEAWPAEAGAHSKGEHISVDEAAGLLGVTARRTRDLAAAGLGVKVGRAWLLDRRLVETEAARRAA